MPGSALEHVDVDYVVPVSDMGSTLSKLVIEPVQEQPSSDRLESRIEYETEMAELDGDALNSEQKVGQPSEFGCPDCGGVLYEVQEGEIVRFRCRVGHAYSSETLIAAQSESLEEALWVALRALEERAALFLRLARNSREHGSVRTASHFQEQSEVNEGHAEMIRRFLLNGVPAASPETNLSRERPLDQAEV
jgi:two-component system, chemotaxis family, protein-glutamate methylesterase/glutaminase